MLQIARWGAFSVRHEDVYDPERQHGADPLLAHAGGHELVTADLAV